MFIHHNNAILDFQRVRDLRIRASALGWEAFIQPLEGCVWGEGGGAQLQTWGGHFFFCAPSPPATALVKP